jgi:CubicO group peptidase (beta-lactamase class C family)
MRPLLVLSVALSVSAPAQPPTPDFSAVREHIMTRMTATSTPSMAVAVARGPDVLWEEGFGWIDRPGGTAATPDTLYYAASVTKAVTATALMVLHERKQVDLDRRANLYLRGAKLRSPQWNADEATVRQLATHTAGLTTFDIRAPLPAQDVVRRYGIVFWRPGERYDYSNLSFGVIGQIIANVSGRSFQSFVHDEVLRPLGMENAWAGATPQAKHPVAPRYSALLRAFSPPLTEPTLPGGSVLFSSVRELTRFGMFHLQTQAPPRPILSSASYPGAAGTKRPVGQHAPQPCVVDQREPARVPHAPGAGRHLRFAGLAAARAGGEDRRGRARKLRSRTGGGGDRSDSLDAVAGLSREALTSRAVACAGADPECAGRIYR